MFQGYSQETVDFMWGIRFNNERGWFLAHKDDYQQHLLAPTRELGQAVYDGLAAALPHEPLILKVSRIYRDARRLHGQGPTRTTCGSASAPGTRTGRPPGPSILRSPRTITAMAWASGPLPPPP